jgi:hypothetical protein
MTIAGDSRDTRNPQKSWVAWTASLWAQKILRAEVNRPEVVSLTGDYVQAHMEELLPFHRRHFFEMDPVQLRKMRRKFKRLPRTFTRDEISDTTIHQGNIFKTDVVSDADGAYYDWDITGSIREAIKYGLEDAVWDAFESPGTRCMALTVSRRMPGGKAKTSELWREIVNGIGGVFGDSRVWEFEEPIHYGRARLGCGNMMLIRAVIRER